MTKCTFPSLIERIGTSMALNRLHPHVLLLLLLPWLQVQLPNLKWIDNHRNVFKVQLSMVSAVYPQVRLYRHVHTYIHTYVHTYMYIHTYIHVHKYMHTVEPLITDILNSGHLLVTDKSPCTNCISYYYSTKPTSHKRTPLYSAETMDSCMCTSNVPYNYFYLY